MKKKIKIMNVQQIGDEEIERFKDFDSVLAKHQMTGAGTGFNFQKVAIPAVIVMTSLIVYFLIHNSQTKHPAVKNNQQTSPIDLSEQNQKAEEIDTSESADSGKEIEKKTIAPVQKNDQKKSDKVTTPNQQQTTELQPRESQSPVQVYVQAEPVEGYANLYSYFSRELVYPAVAVKDSIQGVITVTFMISKTGKIESVKFLNSLGKPFEEEATRLINNMPLWKAATLNGQPVSSKISLPITFQIQQVKIKN